MNIFTHSHPCDREIAGMDACTYDLSGTRIMTVHPEHKKRPKALLFLTIIAINHHEQCDY